VGVGDDALPTYSTMHAAGRNDALRKLADDTAGFYTELTRANRAPPYSYLIESLRNISHRCRLDVDLSSGWNAAHRLSLTSAGQPVRAPVRAPSR